MLKLDGDRAQKFAANFRRQRPGSVGDLLNSSSDSEILAGRPCDRHLATPRG
jgi:hypothetical protein